LILSDFESIRAEQSLYGRLGGHAGILTLIKPFYAYVLRHDVLGPIFNSHIIVWPAHMEKVADFWALQAGGESKYRFGFCRLKHIFS
jgi:truncated hemoglobin YjbI